MPQHVSPETLQQSNSAAMLFRFEADDNLWMVLKLENGAYVLKVCLSPTPVPHSYLLYQCSELPRAPYLGADLNLKASVQDAAQWEAVSYPGT